MTPLDVILSENPKAQIFLGGPDPEPELLAKARALEARWPGRVVVRGERIDNRHLMSGIDVFLMPSVEEPCGIAQMGAQALGAPVLYLDHHGPKGTVMPFDASLYWHWLRRRAGLDSVAHRRVATGDRMGVALGLGQAAAAAKRDRLCRRLRHRAHGPQPRGAAP